MINASHYLDSASIIIINIIFFELGLQHLTLVWNSPASFFWTFEVFMHTSEFPFQYCYHNLKREEIHLSYQQDLRNLIHLKNENNSLHNRMVEER